MVQIVEVSLSSHLARGAQAAKRSLKLATLGTPAKAFPEYGPSVLHRAF